MAVNVVIPLLIPLEENLHNTTRLLSGAGGGGGPLQFSEPRYCLLLAEDAPPALRIAQVSAFHKDGVGVRYSIRAGNRDGLFTIDQHSGLITLAAPLDYELHAKHELVVGAEAAGHTAHAIVQVTVVDVNDNQPHFLEKDLQVTVVEEEGAYLPATIAKVVARDPDPVDQEGLVYSVGGEGVDGHSPSDAYFTINPHTGDLLLLRALDRDPPLGRDVWKVKVQVRDGQRVSPSLAAASRASRRPRVTQGQHDPFQDSGASRTPWVIKGQYDLSKDSMASRVTRGQYDLSRDSVTSRTPRVTQGQYDLSQDSWTSKRPWVNQGQYDLSQDLGTSKTPRVTQGQYDLSQDLGTSKTPRVTQGQYDLSKDSVASRVTQGQYDISKDSGASRVTQGQYDLSQVSRTSKGLDFASQDLQVSPRRQSLVTRIPGETAQRHYFHTQDLKVGAREEPYFLRQDLSTPEGRYFLTQDPLVPFGLTIPENEEEEEEKEEEKQMEEGQLKVNVNQREEEERGGASRADDRLLLHKVNERRGIRGSKRPGNTGNITNLKLPRMKNELNENRRRTTERSRKLRDNNHRNTRQDARVNTKSKLHVGKRPNGAGTKGLESPKIHRGRKASGAGTKGLESPNISSRTSYGSQARSRKVQQKLTPPARQGRGEEILELTRMVFGDPKSGESTTGRTSLGSAGPPRSKNYHKLSAQRKLLSVRSVSETGPLKRDRKSNFAVKYKEEKRILCLDEVPECGGHGHNSLPPAADSGRVKRPGKVYKNRADQRPSASDPKGTFTSRGESDSPGDSESVAAEETETSAAAAVSKREVNHLTAKHQQRKKPSEDPRYVRRFGADDGGCRDYGAVSVSNKTRDERTRRYPGEMRRERVHVAETVVTVVVKDVNDNAPVFPNVTIYGEVQENGPIDLSAGVVWAWDADDQQEGTNAHLTYSIGKNVVDERSGQAIFAVNPETGLVRTAVCCLDRETTPEYHIQVVATDGGGLKGTGTVVVRLADVNDNSPRLTRDLWQVEVDETWGHGAPSNATLLQVSTADRDTSNYFFYRVVEGSGWGWQHFGMRTEGTVGQLFARQTLDFEDAAHRRGFRFMIQVTDRGRGGWSDARHTDTAWVEVRLRDLNDNPPQFRRPHAHVTVREDAAPGTLLAALPATDADMMMQQGVEYRVEGGWGALSVDGSGGVRLWRALDREAPGGEVGVARVVAVDEGRPSLSSTATLTITVTDVNDCPPRLLPPTLLHVTEGAPASLLGLLTATDDDVWALAHGPPFNFTLAPSNPAHVLDALSIKYDSSADSGRGGAEVWTLGPVDREEHRQLTAEVVVADAGGLAATQPVTVIIDDVNDNPMKPAAKTVYLWKTQGGGADAALGRVYVEDPDDWDLQDKSFSWAGPPHPLFTLQVNTGEIFASTQLREGRYELHFSVSDRVWGQRDVAAKVTVVVRYLSPEALAHAVPVTLTPTTPSALAAGWTPTRGGGGLGTLTEAVTQAVGREAEAVEIVSVYGFPDQGIITLDPTSQRSSLSNASSSSSVVAATAPAPPPPLACVWLSVRQKGGSFVDPVKLHGLLALHLQQVEKVMSLRVALEDTHVVEGKNGRDASGSSVSSPADSMATHNPSSVASLASMALPLQVVDTNVTSLVTPRLTRAQDCQAHTAGYVDDSCTPSSCLNGGRCVRTDLGNRCVCPGGSWGPRCKILARTFSGSGWAWVRPLSPCLPTTLSLRLLTRRPHALILYSGPLSSTASHSHYPPTPMMALQLVGGRPQVVLEGARGPVKLQVNTTLNSGTWHTLHLHLNPKGVTLMVDLCGRRRATGTSRDDHCIARAPWMATQTTESWAGSAPLQVGGFAHPHPHSANYGWSNTLVHQALDGCVSHLTVNGELVDLGEPAYSSESVGGCRPQELACGSGLVSCGQRGRCVNGLNEPRCECLPGWTGPGCAKPTIPIALGQTSYMKTALSFTPHPHHVTLQLRVRTRGRPDGLLVQLAAIQQSSVLKLQLRGGVVCASVSGAAGAAVQAMQEVCLESFPLGDGSWHTVRVGRHGYNMIISVDDGDGWRQNQTLASLLTTTTTTATTGHMQAVSPASSFAVDKQDGVIVGGVPEYAGLTLAAVHDDLRDSCIDDVRVSGHSIPLAPSINETLWGQVMPQQNVGLGCPAPDFCMSATCLPPLSCHDSWRHATCSCEPGHQLVGLSCQDVDECVFQPCLHGGTCHNLRPGYHCACVPTHTGDNCEWAKLPPDTQPLSAPMAIAAITLSLLVIVVLGVLLNIRIQRSRSARGVALRSGGVEGVTGTAGTPVSALRPVDLEDVTGSIGTSMALLHPMGLEGVTGARGTPLEIHLVTDTLHSSATKQGTKHLVTFLGPATLPGESLAIKEVGPHPPGSTATVPDDGGNKHLGKTSPLRCTEAAGDPTSVADVALGHRSSIPPAAVCSVRCPPTAAAAAAAGRPQAAAGAGTGLAQHLPARDDLRAYAYEGDGSPSGSLTSTVLGLRAESLEDESVRPLVAEYGEVFDLLRHLPDAVNTSHSSGRDILNDKGVSGSKSPTIKQTGVNIT